MQLYADASFRSRDSGTVVMIILVGEPSGFPEAIAA
jgi:hypothetical protein